MLRIHNILVWIRIRGSMPLTNGSGSGFCYFRHWPLRRHKKLFFFKVFLIITFWRYTLMSLTIFFKFVRLWSIITNLKNTVHQHNNQKMYQEKKSDDFLFYCHISAAACTGIFLLAEIGRRKLLDKPWRCWWRRCWSQGPHGSAVLGQRGSQSRCNRTKHWIFRYFSENFVT